MHTIVKMLLVILVATSILGLRPGNVIADDSVRWELKPVVKNFSKSELTTLSDYYAKKYVVSADTMRKVVWCESGWNTKAVGDHGKSHGLVQIHQPSNPQVTLEQAEDPDFALDFLAYNLSKGRGSMWTCYRNLKISIN